MSNELVSLSSLADAADKVRERRSSAQHVMGEREGEEKRKTGRGTARLGLEKGTWKGNQREMCVALLLLLLHQHPCPCSALTSTRDAVHMKEHRQRCTSESVLQQEKGCEGDVACATHIVSNALTGALFSLFPIHVCAEERLSKKKKRNTREDTVGKVAKKKCVRY